ncbi:MAG: aldo/keto reductase [Candidatus Latescibacteria bacterium]|nr:aldo/keto reductase [Candidatus Latescibacterota bacterium]
MKRRDFIKYSTVGAVGMGLTGCSALRQNKMTISKNDIRYSDFSFEATVPKPSPGTMPTAELGTTGIKVSKFGFGSHMRQDIITYFKERQQIIREAHDFGVTLFDVYDKEHEVYQYEPMGKHLAPIINDVVVSIALLPYEGRTFEQEFERDLRLFGRDYIDMVRIHTRDPKSKEWENWDKLFRWKEQGKIRAVGVPIHYMNDLDGLLDVMPLDYVLFPYNYYHNTCWHGYPAEGQNPDFEPLPEKLRKRGIGVMTMKAYAGDPLQAPINDIAKNLNRNKDLNYNQAALRYVINSPVKPDTTVTGMYNLDHLYLNVEAYYNPQISSEEREFLKKMRNSVKLVARDYLPKHYAFLDDWASPVSDLDRV